MTFPPVCAVECAKPAMGTCLPCKCVLGGRQLVTIHGGPFAIVSCECAAQADTPRQLRGQDAHSDADMALFGSNNV